MILFNNPTYLLPFLVCILLSCNDSASSEVKSFANNPVIAHRGAWKTDNLPQNSIAALNKAITLNCVGSEFDVRMTKDNVLIVTHDADYDGKLIEEHTYKELAITKLENGEVLPTLEAFLKAGMEGTHQTGLVCEIKPASSPERSLLMADKVYELVDKLDAHDHVSYYISFSYDVLKRLEELDSQNRTLYLDGSATPEKVKMDGIDGLDYLINKFKNKPEWLTTARENDLILNAWTVNKKEDVDWLIAEGFDYITTDEPELALQCYEQWSMDEEYKLVWNDEFFGKGRPDSTKWRHEVGFKRNQELQFYVNDSSTSFLENGNLVMKVKQDTIKNEDFVSKDFKGWRKKREYAYYTAPSLITKNLASWKYGYIEVKAKLPQGRGLWPAFWMLGENFQEVGWPECGEIDIMEHVGFNPDSIFGTIHTLAYNHTKGTERGKHVFVDDPYKRFHTYAIEWTPEKIDFLLDGKVYHNISNENKTTAEWPFDQEFNLRINIAVGGMLGGRKGIDDEIFPQEMIIDYVRVYQKENYETN